MESIDIFSTLEVVEMKHIDTLHTWGGMKCETWTP